ncbi:hypothetical protein T8K17_01485 [Thalassobaculum sp. OXR-137]|uniref:hypothetical protein n=1 Tax=Thalassobaculum sp. OXR-137 TaxID=3100173 RepID=UPI002AC97C8B|nr:hypothetical protein [Thalassobaculum sp. OXR-137]WPZ34821.1 hypothetical protein T8K17_01485 [Thalassobaculum sp. OXR-137]
MPLPYSHLAGLALAGLALSACATITKGADQTVTIQTDPAGAVCRMEREGMTIAVVNPTPGTVQIDKSKNAVVVKCSADGHQDTFATLASEFQDMTVGNVVFGGLIGLAIDASSGAMNQYPSEITLLLVPESFPTEQKKDTFFQSAIDRAQARTDAAVAQIKAACKDDDGCKREVSVAETAGATEISQLKSQWATAKVDS